ncbi:hypothetical protein RD792_015150 [Penstemon davidsonii]|uniref:ATP-dependent helicase C-terminal domain-containing protein n=1 Tax=Penstemon davidsonii TaxID=160366 RepID=A0ABR0CS84_9LAMI|nr:hypothetical protein RD792_015150 [Penstemon davidsonii]
MEEFSRLGVGSIILTSGTLSPLDSFAEELKLEFPIRLENPHVITGNQIWAGVVPVGPSGYSLNSSYRNRGSIEYKLELGNAIVNFARRVPDGLLIFFPSYYLLEQCISCWKTTGQLNSTTVWERICKHKLPVVEPRQSSLFSLAIEDYMTKLKDPSSSGAMFFAVCRGKVSEGLDFADCAGRAVIITGLPFAAMNEPKVRLKREYLDQQGKSQRTGSKGLTGEEWYSQQASRAVNQAVGRVIRHQHDYGAIILCDERCIHCYSKFGDIVYSLTRFFRDGGTRGPTKLDLTRNLDQEDVKVEVSQSPQLLDKFHLENLLVPQTTPTSRDQSHSLDKASSSKQVKQGNTSVKLREIVPANRSYLTSNKLLQDSNLKSLSDLARTGEKYLIRDKNMQDLDGETSDLIAPSMSKKPRLLITGPNHLENHEKLDHQFKNFVKHENLQFSEVVSTDNPQENRRVLVNCETITQKKSVALIKREDNDAVSQTLPPNGEEKKGSAFLVQVREKLTDSEYKEFVGFMKALKSKAMKIDLVLQSIARLFSLPERTSLLQGYQIQSIGKLYSIIFIVL